MAGLGGSLTFDPGTLAAMEIDTSRAGPSAVCPLSSSLQNIRSRKNQRTLSNPATIGTSQSVLSRGGLHCTIQ